jgi:hypothetical protein
MDGWQATGSYAAVARRIEPFRSAAKLPFMMKTLLRLLVLSLVFVRVVHSEPARTVAGSLGAIEIPFTMPMDGVATIGIYNKEGRLLRPLAQALPLLRGENAIRWDGMDLWGNLLPTGTEAEVKIFAGPGIRAKWEFGIASPNPVPWPTKPFGEGEAMRTGGWLGDHGVSASAVAVGDRIFFGSTMAEHGHTVIFCNLEGEKMWGRGGLEGWKGPRILVSDGKAIFGVVEKNHVHRLEISGEKSAQIVDTLDDEIFGLAAHDGKLVLTLGNHEVSGSLVEPSVGDRDFDFGGCLPAPDKTKAYNRNLTGQQQFATTFFDGGHPQTGITPAGTGSSVGIVASFKSPVKIGTLLVERMEIPANAEFYVLKAGTKYDPSTMAPEPGAAPGAAWQLWAKSDLARRVNVVSSASAASSEALYIRLAARDAAAPGQWPQLKMCRILPKPFTRADDAVAIQIPPDSQPREKLPGVLAGDAAWAFRTVESPSQTSPTIVMVDLKRETSFDALLLLNCINQTYAIDAWSGGSAAPDPNSSDNWTEIATFDAGSRTVEGALAASQSSNDARVSLAQTAKTRAIRLRITSGMGSGRWGNPPNKTDPLRSEAAEVALLKLTEGRPNIAKMILQVRDATTGALISEVKDESVNMTAMAYDPAGNLYSIADGKLCKTTLPGKGGPVKHQVLNQTDLKKPACIGVSPDGARIAVGDSEAKTVFVFDNTGKITTRIGGIGPRKTGPWDPHTVDQPSSVTIDKLGKIWVSEKTYTPKRITRYSADGKFEKEFLGPPHYGGGGAIDPALKTFWYEACEYEVDFAKGTTRLKNLNDVMSDPNSPAPDVSAYSYTGIGRPIFTNGHRYISDRGGTVICLFDEGQKKWTPASVMGNAQNAQFLIRADKPWRDHWLKQDLSDSSFIWSDLNEDGIGQIEEVQLFKNADVMGGMKGKPFDRAYWGNLGGQDLTFWGRSARLTPTRFTPKGVPVFEKAKIQPFDYASLAPTYLANQVSGMAAKPSFGNASMVARDGSLVVETQPYLVRPDLTILGGPVKEKPSEYVPKILGKILNNPLGFVGSAPTKSPVGEVAVVNGDNGQWYLWSVQNGVLLDEFFTGTKGGFSGLTDPKRGMDITDYKQDFETFSGYFTAALDGKYYVIAGRGHFGLSRLEGIDEIQVIKKPVTITPEAFAANTQLRPQIAGGAADKKGKKKQKRELKLPSLAKRVKAFQLDGDLAEWGDPGKFQTIGEDANMAFDAAWDDTNLTIAYRGLSGTGNRSEDWRYLFKTGFAFDLMIRSDPAQSAGQPAAGDRRVVFGQHKGKWVAVMYEYVAPGAKPGEGVDYTSPVTSTRVDRVTLLPANAARIAFKELAQKGTAGSEWSAEVQIPWATLGIKPALGQKITADFGILSPDSGGIQVDKRSYWSDPDTSHVADLAVEAQIHPANWGKLYPSE